MSQTNTNTGAGNTNRNQNAARGRRAWGGSGGQGLGGSTSGRENSSIAKYSFKRKMKDGCLSKLTITDGSNRATWQKKIVDTLPLFCADKEYQFVGGIICKDTEVTEADFKEIDPDSDLWSIKYYIEINTINPNVPAVNGVCPPIKEMVEKIRVFDTNIQKQLLTEYE